MPWHEPRWTGDIPGPKKYYPIRRSRHGGENRNRGGKSQGRRPSTCPRGGAILRNDAEPTSSRLLGACGLIRPGARKELPVLQPFACAERKTNAFDSGSSWAPGWDMVVISLGGEKVSLLPFST